MAELAASASASQPTVNNFGDKIKSEIERLNEEIEHTEENRKVALAKAKASVMKDESLTDEEKIFIIENLKDPTRWTILSKLFGGLSFGYIFNTVVFLIIIIALNA